MDDWIKKRRYFIIQPLKEGNPATCNNMDETRRHKWNKPDTERPLYDLTYI